MARKKQFAVISFSALAFVMCCACVFGQSQPHTIGQTTPGAQKQASKAPPTHGVSPTANASTPPASPPALSSLLDHPAEQAKIKLDSGKLTVQANNSVLAEILRQISKDSGMKIEGLETGGSANQRIFGSYGPGTPREVLSELLDGSGYNVMMLGATPSGVPRELALTSRSGSTSPPVSGQPQTVTSTENGDDSAEPTQYPDDQQNLNPPPGPPEIQNGVRTPEQMLQELEKLQQQHQQDQQDPQAQQPN